MFEPRTRTRSQPSFLAFCGGALAAAAIALSAYAAHAAAGPDQSRLQTAALFAFGHGLALAAFAPRAASRGMRAALLALLAGVLQFASWYGLVAVAVVYGVGQLVESLWLTPRLVGERIGMNPLMVIFALLAFGHLFGFAGVLIALPVSALIVVAARRLQAAYLASPLYRG